MIGAGREELEESYLGDIALDEPPGRAGRAGGRRPDAGAGLSRRLASSRARGEVLGIYGFMGCGQIELARTLFGKLQPERGALEIAGSRPARAIPPPRARRASPMSPESRRAMLFGEEPIYKNVSIAFLERLSRWLLKPTASARMAGEQIKALGIRPPASRRACGALSGGNQQKVALAKWLTRAAEGAGAGRADARHGRRRQGGRGADRALAARPGHGGHRALDRAGDGAFARRPRAGDAQGRDRRANSPSERSARTACWRRLEERCGHGCSQTPTPSPPAPRSARPICCATSCATSRRSPRCCSWSVFFSVASPSFATLGNLENILQQVSVTGDHRRRADLRHPDRRDRPQRRRHRQRHGDRADVLHAAAGLREHRQHPAARLARDHPGARRLLRARAGHRVRRHQDRHPLLHHDAGDDADRRRHFGGAGARADRLSGAVARADARLEIARPAFPGSSSSRRCCCSSRISC